MKIISPLQLADLDLSQVSDEGRTYQIDGMPLLWANRETFGPFLRDLRNTSGLSLRKAATQVGISHALLARLETGEQVGPPSPALLDDLAEVYRADVRQILHEAGYRLEVADSPAVDPKKQTSEYFRALVLHPSLRPPLLREEEIRYIPYIVKRHWVDHIQNIVKQNDPQALIEDILDNVDASLGLQDDAGEVDDQESTD